MSFDINQQISEKIPTNAKLTSDLINKKQQSYSGGNKYESSPVQDSVTISGKEKKEKWYQKYKKQLPLFNDLIH